MQHGHEGYLRVWEAGIEAFDVKIDFDEVIDFGDRLLTIGRQFGQGRASGVPVDQRVFQVITLRRGLVIQQRDFADREAALKAAGLPE